jgi:hypothetical protein
VADREDEDAVPQEEPARPPLDEDAAWAALVAGFDQEPEPGTAAWPEAENLPEGPAPDEPDPTGPTARDAMLPPTRSIVIHPVIAGPRDYEPAEDDEEDAHFVPPEPPPLPDADVTTKFAWIAVLGGPLLLLGFVLFQVELTWWAVTVGLGGFLGGFGTLVARMRTGEDDDDLPGGGAVV